MCTCSFGVVCVSHTHVHVDVVEVCVCVFKCPLKSVSHLYVGQSTNIKPGFKGSIMTVRLNLISHTIHVI